MNIQEQEERDYSPLSWQEQCVQESRMLRQGDDRQKIREAIESGKFVVIEERTDYCRYTDAIIGSSEYMLSQHDTREEADRQCAIDSEILGPESGVFVWPRENPPKPPEVSYSDDSDSIPF